MPGQSFFVHDAIFVIISKSFFPRSKDSFYHDIHVVVSEKMSHKSEVIQPLRVLTMIIFGITICNW
jgi:hypothetical protein